MENRHIEKSLSQKKNFSSIIPKGSRVLNAEAAWFVLNWRYHALVESYGFLNANEVNKSYDCIMELTRNTPYTQFRLYTKRQQHRLKPHCYPTKWGSQYDFPFLMHLMRPARFFRCSTFFDAFSPPDLTISPLFFFIASWLCLALPLTSWVTTAIFPFNSCDLSLILSSALIFFSDIWDRISAVASILDLIFSLTQIWP